MKGTKPLEELLAPYSAGPRPGAGRSAFRSSSTPLRRRIDAQVDRLAQRFSLDRLLYDVEVDAQARWLANLAAFDAYAAERERRSQER
jgi:hypothetical protein